MTTDAIPQGKKLVSQIVITTVKVTIIKKETASAHKIYPRH